MTLGRTLGISGSSTY